MADGKSSGKGRPSREERLAAELRQNLKRRKVRERALDAAAQSGSKPLGVATGLAGAAADSQPSVDDGAPDA